ncbi:MAG: hypothetical protein JF618_14415, partial [Leifsonia sp.]|nr:hypothetical protein [Leifsonia sp.]
MTTFQDPPLQSRRAVRQNERDGQAAATQSSTGAESVAPEPLTYATTQRPPVPEYDGPGFRSHRSADPAPTADEAQQDGTYRPRDFSPEGRRAASPTWAPQYGGVTDDGAIDFQTQARADIAAASAASGSAPAPATPARPMPQPLPVDDAQIDAIEQTLTRRELRALRDAHGISAVTTGDTVLPDAAAVQ